MCLAKPLKLIAIAPDSRSGTVDIGGDTLPVGLDLVPGAKTGDYVLVHAGMAIELLDIEDAESILETYERYVTTQDRLIPGDTDDPSG